LVSSGDSSPSSTGPESSIFLSSDLSGCIFFCIASFMDLSGTAYFAKLGSNPASLSIFSASFLFFATSCSSSSFCSFAAPSSFFCDGSDSLTSSLSSASSSLFSSFSSVPSLLFVSSFSSSARILMSSSIMLFFLTSFPAPFSSFFCDCCDPLTNSPSPALDSFSLFLSCFCSLDFLVGEFCVSLWLSSL